MALVREIETKVMKWCTESFVHGIDSSGGYHKIAGIIVALTSSIGSLMLMLYCFKEEVSDFEAYLVAVLKKMPSLASSVDIDSLARDMVYELMMFSPIFLGRSGDPNTYLVILMITMSAAVEAGVNGEEKGEGSAGVKGKEFGEEKGEGSADVKGKEFVEVKGKGSAGVKGKEFVEEKGEGSADVKGKEFVEEKGEGSADVKGKEFVEVKGEEADEFDEEARDKRFAAMLMRRLPILAVSDQMGKMEQLTAAAVIELPD